MFIGFVFDFVEYCRWFDIIMFEVLVNVDLFKKLFICCKCKIFCSGIFVMKKLVFGLIWIFLFFKLFVYYYFEVFLEDKFVMYGFFYWLVVLYMVGFIVCCKYYGVWIMIEGVCILVGLGFKGVDFKIGKVFWERFWNIDFWEVEFV